MPVSELPQGRIHYRVAGPEGSARVVVFAHGMLVGHELWTPVADRLAARGIRSYAPDLPMGAHPEALRESADRSPRGLARLLLDFVASLNLRDVTLVGNDTGGALCQFAIDADPGRIGRLVLTNCDGFEKFPPPPFNLLVKAGSRAFRLRALMAPMRARPLRHSIVAFGPLAASRLDSAMTRRWVDPILADARVRADTAAFLRAIDPADLLDVSTRLGRFDRPVRLVWGEADRFFTVDLGRRLEAAFPNAELTTVPGARTFVPLDAPDDLAAAIVESADAARRSGSPRN